jgi:AAA domain-containing protein
MASAEIVVKNADGGLSIVPRYQTKADFGKVIAATENRAVSTDWRSNLCSVSALQKGGTKMLINNFMPEGTTMVGALAGCGKTFFALSICKALTTGKPFLGQFEVPEIVPVLYLAPETSGSSFRARCEKFGIPDDGSLFLCRTISEGAPLALNDPAVLAAVGHMKPVVVLDTVIRFSKSTDENSASANKVLSDEINNLKAAGARGVLCLHHATKSSRKEGLTLESALRGTGDMAAVAQGVYGLRRNDALHDNGNGPTHLQVMCLKPPDFDAPPPFTIALKVKSGDELVSCIDTRGDFLLFEPGVEAQEINSRFVELVTKHPDMSLSETAEALDTTKRRVQSVASKLGFRKGKTGWFMSSVKVGVSTDPKTSEEITV